MGLVEAASVCLQEEGHRSPTPYTLSQRFDKQRLLVWHEPEDLGVATRTHADPHEATEDGAYAVAMAVVRRERGLVVMSRSAKGPGFDYYLGKPSAAPLLFQGAVRLEVSGIRKGNDSKIRGRQASKAKQISRSQNTGLPGITAIVEFSRPLVALEDK